MDDADPKCSPLGSKSPQSTLIISICSSLLFTLSFSDREGFGSGGSSNAFGGDDILQTRGFAFSPILPPEFLLLFRLLMSDLVEFPPNFDISIGVTESVFDGLRRSLLSDRKKACAVVKLMARLGGCGVNCGLAQGNICNVSDGAVFALRLSLGFSITGLMVFSLL
jgi:hypothetical protein